VLKLLSWSSRVFWHVRVVRYQGWLILWKSWSRHFHLLFVDGEVVGCLLRNLWNMSTLRRDSWRLESLAFHTFVILLDLDRLWLRNDRPFNSHLRGVIWELRLIIWELRPVIIHQIIWFRVKHRGLLLIEVKSHFLFRLFYLFYVWFRFLYPCDVCLLIEFYLRFFFFFNLDIGLKRKVLDPLRVLLRGGCC